MLSSDEIARVAGDSSDARVFARRVLERLGATLGMDSALAVTWPAGHK